MKIIAINGSYRAEQGHTHHLLSLLGEGVQTAQAEFEIIHLAKHKIKPCRGCGKCHGEAELRPCVYAEQDDAAAIFQQIAQADLVIYAAPVYVFGISALLKTLLERMYATGDIYDLRLTQSGKFFHHIDQTLCAKPFVSLITCDNIDAAMPANASHYFRTYSQFMDAPQVGALVRKAGRLFAHGQNPAASERFPKIKAIYAAYQQAGYELGTQGQISRSTQAKANQEVLDLPFFGLLKRFSPFKRVMINKSRDYF